MTSRILLKVVYRILLKVALSELELQPNITDTENPQKILRGLFSLQSQSQTKSAESKSDLLRGRTIEICLSGLSQPLHLWIKPLNRKIKPGFKESS